MIKKILGLMMSVCLILSVSTNSFAKECEKISIEDFLIYAEEIGDIYEIDPYLLLAMCEAESSMNICAENGQCLGLMQVSEKWHADRMERLGVESLFDPYGNILVAADFLSELFEINEDPYYVLMRYNMKISTANELYKKGEISYYARSIMERVNELHTLDEKHQEKIEENKNDMLPCGGVTAWLK